MDEAIVIPVALFIAIAVPVTIAILSRARTRRLLIERGLLDGRYADVLAAESRLRTLGALKWGLVLAGYAVGMIVADLLGFRFDGPPSPAGIGLIVLGTAVGFLAYYLLARKDILAPAGPTGLRNAPPVPTIPTP